MSYQTLLYETRREGGLSEAIRRREKLFEPTE